MERPAPPQNEVTHILQEANRDSKQAYDELMPLIYDELLEIARFRMRREKESHTYCRTELVHEAYFRLINIDNITWQDRSHFFAIASKCMRQLLINYANKKKAAKRGGDKEPATFNEYAINVEREADELIDLDGALNKLSSFDERLAKVVECRFFGEMTVQDTATALDISSSTVKRDWAEARGWLYRELNT